MLVDGADEVRRAVRDQLRKGASQIKLFVSGGVLSPVDPIWMNQFNDEEIRVAVEECHKRNRQVAAHVRGNDGVKLCTEAGVDVLEHATYADDEAIAMIAERKDDLFVVPGLGYHWGILNKGVECGIPPEVMAATEYQEEWDLGCQAMEKLKNLGVRVIPGGDYGFVWCPHGEYAKDIELFVTDMGFSPMEAIVAATKHGSELMRLADDPGTGEEGKVADLLVVDGDPLADIAILQDRSRLAMVMKDGQVMVNTLGLPQVLQPLPDFTMDVEIYQRRKATVDPMPTAAEVQH
jgi:imidazolonepropionase-like amidohydrolase